MHNCGIGKLNLLSNASNVPSLPRAGGLLFALIVTEKARRIQHTMAGFAL